MQQEQIVSVPETEIVAAEGHDLKVVNAMPASKMQTRSMLRASRSSAASAETNRDSKTSKSLDCVDVNPEKEDE